MALLALAALVARAVDNDSVRDNFMKFGYAIIPLVMGSHMGHNLFHLLAEGKSIYYTAIGLGGGVVPGGSTALVSTGTLVALQFVLIALGALASLYAAYRIARSNYGSRAWAAFAPYAVLIVLLTAASVWLLRFPMAMRM